jgi:hypothetical protein
MNAATYPRPHRQHRSTWASEVVLRPRREKWLLALAAEHTSERPLREGYE